MKIDGFIRWSEFEVGSLVRIIPGKGCSQKEINEHPGELEVVQSTGVNNSITGKMDRDYCLSQKYIVSTSSCLTVVGTGQGAVGYVTYHSLPVVVGNNAKLLQPFAALDENQMLFLAGVLNVLRDRFSYSDIVSIDRYSRMVVQLPVDGSGDPDWERMGNYMRELRVSQEEKLDSIVSLSALRPRQVDVSRWGEYQIDQLFNVVKGSRLKSTDRVPGEIPYVGASQFNNGITHYIGNDEHLHPGGVLTVCYNGPVGTTFYQPDAFWATDDVNVLYPITDVSPEALLFVAPVIEQIGSKYAYIDKWKLEDMKSAIIKLPQDASGEPDWAYMEAYMKSMIEQKASDLDILETLLPESGETEVV